MANRKFFSPITVLIVVSVFFIALSVSISMMNSMEPKVTSDKGPASNTELIESSLENEPEKITYLVKNYNGKIAVFEKGQNKPFKITSVNIDDLPDADKKILAKGIEAESQKQLSTILEDYCS